MLKAFAAGIILTLAAGLLGAYAFISLGGLPVNADAEPGRLEEWAARKSLHASLRRLAPKMDNPLAADEANLRAGVRLYGADCAVCHGASDAKASRIAQGLYQKPPQFAEDGVEDDPDGRICWTVRHGIRLTGMPAFGPTLGDTQLWQLTLLLNRLDKLPPRAEKAWKALPSAAPGRG